MTAPQLTPPDRTRCQAEITTYSAFVMGGPTRQTKRCEAKPTTIIVEKKPGKDGLIGSMALCTSCLLVARQKLGTDRFRESAIRPSARRPR